jgi:hypothetical protein
MNINQQIYENLKFFHHELHQELEKKSPLNPELLGKVDQLRCFIKSQVDQLSLGLSEDDKMRRIYVLIIKDAELIEEKSRDVGMPLIDECARVLYKAEFWKLDRLLNDPKKFVSWLNEHQKTVQIDETDSLTTLSSQKKVKRAFEALKEIAEMPQSVKGDFELALSSLYDRFCLIR